MPMTRTSPTSNERRLRESRVVILLALHWASKNQKLTPIVLEDVSDDAKFNRVIRKIKNKVGGGVETQRRRRTIARGEKRGKG
jgi:hypothetical protein